MSKRRAKGAGTIQTTRDGKYRARFAFTVGGQRESIDGSPFDTYEAAEAALDGLLAALRARGSRRGTSLRKAAKRALDLREKEGFHSIDSERERWRCYFEKSEFSDLLITEIDKGAMRDFLADQKNKRTGEPLSVSTRKNILNLVRAILEICVEDTLLEDNPLFGMRIRNTGSIEEELRPLSHAQLLAFVGAATDPAVAIKGGTGMRSGEMRALVWERDVFLDGPKPHVLSRCGKPNKPRKNGKVVRVPLFGIALTAFESIPKEQRRGIVFPAKRGGYRPKGRLFNRLDWKAWLKAAGIDRLVRPHDLRHTCATLLLNGDFGRKWSYEEVKEMLGHSSVKVTERYAKVLGTLAEKAAAEMRKPKKIRPPKRPPVDAEIIAQATEILQRRGWDSNPRVPVLQTHTASCEIEELEAICGLVEAHAAAVITNDDFAHARGLTAGERFLAYAQARLAMLRPIGATA